MNLKKRIIKLEEKTSKTRIDPRLDAELTEWLKSHPDYRPFTHPESNNGVVMPEHLIRAVTCRMNKLFAERNLEPHLCNLLKIYKDLF